MNWYSGKDDPQETVREAETLHTSKINKKFMGTFGLPLGQEAWNTVIAE